MKRNRVSSRTWEGEGIVLVLGEGGAEGGLVYGLVLGTGLRFGVVCLVGFILGVWLRFMCVDVLFV